MLLDVLSILIGLAGLLIGGEWLIRSATRLAAAFGLPTLIIAITVVALGTSMPELVVSVSAAIGSVTDVAIGNVVGSNIANIGLILGLAGMIRPMAIDATLIRREIPIMALAGAVAFVMALDGGIGRGEGVALLVGYIAFTFILYRTSPREAPSAGTTQEVQAIGDASHPVNMAREIVFLVLSVAILAAGAQFTVNGAVSIARAIGVSELVIGLTLVSVGTSLPEIVTSVMASIRGSSDIAAGNAIGSNIANILVILAVTAIILPIPVTAQVLSVDMPVMLLLSIAIIPLVLNRRLSRWQAALLLAAYATYIGFTVAAG